MVDQMSMQEILDAASDESFVSQMIDANPWHKSYAVRVTKFIHALYDSVPEGWEPQGNTSWRLRPMSILPSYLDSFMRSYNATSPAPVTLDDLPTYLTSSPSSEPPITVNQASS